MTLEGDRSMKRKLEAAAGDKGMRKEARAALLELGDRLVVRIEADTPKKTGNLARTTKRRALVSGKREDLRVTIVQGGPEAPYAARVHETHPTQAGWMERDLREAAGTAGRQLAERIDLARAAKESGGA